VWKFPCPLFLLSFFLNFRIMVFRFLFFFLFPSRAKGKEKCVPPLFFFDFCIRGWRLSLFFSGNSRRFKPFSFFFRSCRLLFAPLRTRPTHSLSLLFSPFPALTIRFRAMPSSSLWKGKPRLFSFSFDLFSSPSPLGKRSRRGVCFLFFPHPS